MTIYFFLIKKNMDSEDLTYVLQKIQQLHYGSIFYKASSSYHRACRKISIGDLHQDNFTNLFDIPVGTFKPTHFRFDDHTMPSRYVLIPCLPLEGSVTDNSGIEVDISSYIPVYIIPKEDRTIELGFYPSLDFGDYRSIPGPNEEGVYRIPELGDFTKSCRSR